MKVFTAIFILLFAILNVAAQIEIDENGAVFIDKSKRPGRNPPAEQSKQNIIEQAVLKYVNDFNRNSAPVVELRFEGFFSVPKDLTDNLQVAFPKHKITVANISIYHHAWSEGSGLIIITERKSGKIIIFTDNPLGSPDISLAPFTKVFNSYRAKNDSDDLLKLKTLAEVFLLPIKGRIGEIKQGEKAFSILLCHGDPGIRDLGIMMRAEIGKQFRFDQLYLEGRQWQRGKCTP